MSKIALLSANPARFPFPVYPLGMGYVAGACAEAGHEVVQLDVQVEDMDRTLGRLKEFDPALVGLSIRNIDNCDSANFTSYIEYYCDLIRRIRSVVACPVILGGSGFSLYAPAMMRRTGADYGVIGEGEQTLVAILRDLDAGRIPPRGRLFDVPRPFTFQGFRAPVRSPHLVEYYLRFGGIMNVQTKRGCPYACTYCAYPVLEGESFRRRDAAEVFEECRELVTRFGADYIYFTDSVFNDPEGHYLEVVEQFVRHGLKCHWTGFFRPQSGWRREDIRLLKSSGMDCIEWGSDCTTEATLAGMKKGFDWAAVEESNNLFAEAEIANGHYLIFGGPGETAETVGEGLANLARLRDSVCFAFIGIRIIPNTDIHRLAIREGVVDASWDGLEEKFYFAPGLDRLTVDALIRKSFAGDPYRIYPPTGHEKLIAALHEQGLKGPLWDHILKSKMKRRT